MIGGQATEMTLYLNLFLEGNRMTFIARCESQTAHFVEVFESIEVEGIFFTQKKNS